MISSDALNAIAVKAILDSLTEEDREKFFSTAIASLFERNDPTSIRDKRTKFQAAFDEALISASNRVIHDILEDPKYLDRLKQVITECVEKVLFGEGLDTLTKKLSQQVSVAFYRGVQDTFERWAKRVMCWCRRGFNVGSTWSFMVATTALCASRATVMVIAATSVRSSSVSANGIFSRPTTKRAYRSKRTSVRTSSFESSCERFWSPSASARPHHLGARVASHSTRSRECATSHRARCQTDREIRHCRHGSAARRCVRTRFDSQRLRMARPRQPCHRVGAKF